MTSDQLNKLKRDRVILTVFVRYITDVNSVPALKEKVDLFKQILDKIDLLHPEQKSDKTGITTDKNLYREDVEIYGLALAGAVRSCAHDNSDNEVVARMKITKTRLKRLTMEKFKEKCAEIITEARKVADKLGNYGFDSQAVKLFATMSVTFKEKSTEPREVVVKVSNLTQSIAGLFAKEKEIMENHLNPLMIQFITKNIDFYREYEAAKIIEDRGTRRSKPATETTQAQPA